MSNYDNYISNWDEYGNGNNICENCNTQLIEFDENHWICPKCKTKYSYETGDMVYSVELIKDLDEIKRILRFHLKNIFDDFILTLLKTNISELKISEKYSSGKKIGEIWIKVIKKEEKYEYIYEYRPIGDNDE